MSSWQSEKQRAENATPPRHQPSASSSASSSDNLQRDAQAMKAENFAPIPPCAASPSLVDQSESFNAYTGEVLKALALPERWDLILKQCHQDIEAAFTEMVVLGLSDRELIWLQQRIGDGHRMTQERDSVVTSEKPVTDHRASTNAQSNSFSVVTADGEADRTSEQWPSALPSVEVQGFVVDCCLGSGGYGRVYSARRVADDPESVAAYAIKFLHPNLIHDFKSKERFVRESQALSRIDSKYVVRQLAFDFDCPQPYIVFERIQRGSLADEFKRRKVAGAVGELFTAGEVVAFARDMLSAAIAAHAVGVTHRDIKPANLLIDDNGTLRLTDFGMAATSDDSELTATDSGLGTLGYAAPEQLEDAKSVDAKADQFAIGSTIYQLATGQLPYPSQSAASKLKRMRRVKPLLPSLCHSTLDSGFDAIVMRMLEPQPALRFADCQSALRALQIYEQGLRPSRISQVANVWRSARWSLRTRPAFAGFSLSVISLIAGLIWYLVIQDGWTKQDLAAANRDKAQLAARLVDAKAAAASRLAEERMAMSRELLNSRMSSVTAGDYPRPFVASRLTGRAVCGYEQASAASVYASAIEDLLSTPPVAVERYETRPRMLPAAMAGSADGLIATATHAGAVYLCSDAHPGFSQTLSTGRIIHEQSPLSFHGEEFAGQPPSKRAEHFYTSLCWNSVWHDYLRTVKQPALNIAPFRDPQLTLHSTCEFKGTLFAGTLQGRVRQWDEKEGWRDVAQFDNNAEGVEAISHLQWLDDSLYIVSRTGKIVPIASQAIALAAIQGPISLNELPPVFDAGEEIADLVLRQLSETASGPSSVQQTPPWVGCLATRSGRVTRFESRWDESQSYELNCAVFDLDITIQTAPDEASAGDYTIAIGCAHALPYLWRQSANQPERLSNRYALNDDTPIHSVCFNAAGNQLLAMSEQCKYSRWDLSDSFSRERFSFTSKFLTNKRTLGQPDLGRIVPQASYLGGYMLPHHNAWVTYDMWKSVGWLQVPGIGANLDSGFDTIAPSDAAVVELDGHDWLVVGGDDGRLQLIDTSTQEVLLIQLNGAIVAVEALSDQAIVAAANGDLVSVTVRTEPEAGGIAVHRAVTRLIATHSNRLIDADLDRVRQRICCLSSDLMTTVYDLNGQLLMTANVFGSGVDSSHTTEGGAIAVSPDGQKVAVVCDDQMAAAFDLDQREAVDALFETTGNRSLATIWWNDRSLSFDHGADGYSTSVLKGTKEFGTRAVHGRCVEFAKLAGCCGLIWSARSELSVVDLPTGRIAATFAMPITDEHAQLCISPSGGKIWVVTSSGKVVQLVLPIMDVRPVPELEATVTEISRGERVWCLHPKLDDDGTPHFLVANSIRSDQFQYTQMQLARLESGTGLQSEVLEVSGLPNYAGLPLSNQKLDAASTRLFFDRDQNPLILTRVARIDVDQSAFSTHLGRRRTSGQWDWVQVTDVENWGYAPMLVPSADLMHRGETNCQQLFDFDRPNFEILHTDFWFQRACRTLYEDGQWKLTTHLEMGVQAQPGVENDATWLVAGEYRGYSVSCSSVLHWDRTSGSYQVQWLGPLGVASAKLIQSHPDFALVAVLYHDRRQPAELLRVTPTQIERVMQLPYGIELAALEDGTLVCVEVATGTETQILLHRHSTSNTWSTQRIYRGPASQEPSALLLTNGKAVGVVANLTTDEDSSCIYIEPKLPQ